MTFDLVLANDYKVEVWSDRQTGQQTPPEAPLTRAILDERNPVLLEIARAPDNTKDGSNRRRLVFDYGLPTATQIYGFTIEAQDVLGFNFYGEYDINQKFRQYPNLALFTDDRSFEDASTRADAWMMNLSFQGYPWFFFGEAFSMDHDYSTSSFLLNQNGDINYDQPGPVFLRIRRRQRRSGPHSRLAAIRSARSRFLHLPRLGRKQRLCKRLQPERQSKPSAIASPITTSPFSGTRSTDRSFSLALT